MKINFLSFNLGGTHDKNWESVFHTSKQWTKLFSRVCKKNEIWAVCTQEDARDSSFINGLKNNEHFKDYTAHHTFFAPSLRKLFHVHLCIFFPKSKNKNVSATEEIIVLSKFICTSFKGSVVITIIDTASRQTISFIGAHFPFDPHNPKKPEKQIEALNKIHEKILLLKSNITFIFGDLNFRMINNQDSLLDYLSKNKCISKNLTNATRIDTIVPTCKTIKKRSSCCEVKNNDEYHKKCYNASRTPSYCDRVLVHIDPVKNAVLGLKVVHVKTQVILFEPANESDHNAIYSVVEIKTNMKEPIIFLKYNL